MSQRNDWRIVGDRSTGGEVAHGLKSGSNGRPVMRVSVPFANADLEPADAYRLATGMLEQLREAGYIR